MLTLDLFEKWSDKYKKSIDCSHPKGFSQKAHCAGRKKHNESIDSAEPAFIQALRDFLPIALEVLELDHIPKIKLKKQLGNTNVPTFGRFTNEEKVVYCVITNRHPNDILRTLAHEMAHYAQGERGELDADSWHTGSPAENDANAQAGVVMREFNKQFPKYLKLKPIVIETADYERDMQSDPSNPIPFPKGTTLVNVSDVYDWYKLGMAVPSLEKADPRIFNRGVPHTVFAFGSEEEEHRMTPLLKRLGFTLHDIDKPEDYEKAIRASDVVEHLEQYVAEQSEQLEENQEKYIIYLNDKPVSTYPTDREAESQANMIAQKFPTAKIDIKKEVCTLSPVQLEENLRSIEENFADGKGPGRPGDSQRHGIPKGATMAQLEKAAKAPGRKGQLARWQINMRRGRKK